MSQRIASTLGFKSRMQVMVSKVCNARSCTSIILHQSLINEQADPAACSASHVEICFKDAYLTRADMWRLVVSELAGKAIYKAQKVLFLGTVKAQVRSIYIRGQKALSAFFDSSTKPIFRSESARYVLFIQMSKEMWDFDTDGTGEIMFHKVINGFLPELFQRWHSIDAHHLVSIILFTRMQYERPMILGSGQSNDKIKATNGYQLSNNTPYQDFYRVLVSDMASGQWSAILNSLKREFKVFLRDVSIRDGSPNNPVLWSQDGISIPPEGPSHVISGYPTAAIRGNILEAINLASSQFSEDHIDRDLVRTGLSIVIITPGTGIFEVDHDLLTMTTDSLIRNGIGIDLVCLSRMPLHSVPLFKYRESKKSKDVLGHIMTSDVSHSQSDRGGSSGGLDTLPDVSTLSRPEDSLNGNEPCKVLFDENRWLYAIPHWVDTSFWTSSVGYGSIQAHGENVSESTLYSSERRVFVPRVRMYEVQMMGVMENEMSNISIPYMHGKPPSAAHVTSKKADRIPPRTQNSFTRVEISRDSQKYPGSPLGISPSPSSLSTRSPQHASVMKQYGSLVQWMDQYDELLFCHPHRKKSSRHFDHGQPNTRSNRTRHAYEAAVSTGNSQKRKHPNDQAVKTEQPKHQTRNRKESVTKSLSSVKSSSSKVKPRNLSRQISFGLRGFGEMTAKSTPITEISSDTAQSTSLLARGLGARNVQKKHTAESVLSGSTDESLDSDHEHEKKAAKMPSTLSLGVIKASEPILIRTPNRSKHIPENDLVTGTYDIEATSTPQDESEKTDIEVDQEEQSGLLSPHKSMTPWLTVLNPSNPHKITTDLSRRLGRWHHIFPHAIRASRMKWKSLCSPASIPLTTEDFPSSEHLVAEYLLSEYEITLHSESDFAENNDLFLKELVGVRLSHGFQVVVGSRVAEAMGISAFEMVEIFGEKQAEVRRTKIVMSKGGTIHRLSKLDSGSVHVKQFKRRSMFTTGYSQQPDRSMQYRPAVRTTLGEGYAPRSITWSPISESYDWERLDTFIAGHEEQRSAPYPDSLRFWRARFVFLPMEGLVNSKRLARPTVNDNEEEVRLEGIHRITQVFNRHRFVPPEERHSQDSMPKTKDPNPLDIIYRTRNPSAIVASELEETLLVDNDVFNSKLVQLLPDSDLFERLKLDLNSLAQAVQSERGITMLDRRWHWRLHYNCFIGFELTTWLLNNFKDIDSREEAVELGRELMEQGLFQHVEKRHDFRDGNFFYQIATDYRVPRAELRNSWFGGRKSDRSVPSTPMAETMMTGYNDPPRSQSGPTGEERPEDGSTTPKIKSKPRVALSKRLIYNVDHKKRSYRRELINLHYDRISSADDCYHLRIEWMNVTPKLIEDAVVQWATSAELYGLRLVELPIGEASRTNQFNPFRAPYFVKLAKQPPKKAPQQYFDANSLTPKAMNEFPYQKAILKKHNFVLDLEAAKDFPASVDVSYSYGSPTYQYSQYISREGVLLAQITDQGDFLLLANRLYNNRSSVRDTHRGQNVDHHDHGSDTRGSPGRVIGNARLVSPGASPHSSPILHATPDVGPGFAKLDIMTPERIAYELEAFCKDAQALEAFYDEVLNKTVTPVPSTPSTESTISNLGPPPAFSLRHVSPTSKVQTGAGGRVKGISGKGSGVKSTT